MLKQAYFSAKNRSADPSTWQAFCGLICDEALRFHPGYQISLISRNRSCKYSCAVIGSG